MSNANEHREPDSLELNKETLQDLDVEPATAGAVKGGAPGGDPISGAALSGPHIAPTDPYQITPYKGGVSR